MKYGTLYSQCNSTEWRGHIFGRINNIGIRLFFRLCGLLGVSYQASLFIITAFSIISLGILIYKYSPSPYWSYLIYIAMGFYLFTFSGLKQTIAMGFLVIAMMKLLEDKIGKYILFVIIAGVFHAPAFIFFLALPFCKVKLSGKFLVIVIVLAILVIANRNQIAEFLSEMYYDSEKDFTASKLIGGRALMMAFIMVIAQFLRPLRNDDTVYRKIFGLMILAFVTQFFSVFNNIFTRLADYFYQFVILYIPMMIEPAYVRLNQMGKNKVYTRDNNLGIIIGLVITAFSVWYYYRYLNGTITYVNTIKFFWEVDPFR